MAEKAQNLERQQSIASVEATVESNIQGCTESSTELYGRALEIRKGTVVMSLLSPIDIRTYSDGRTVKTDSEDPVLRSAFDIQEADVSKIIYLPVYDDKTDDNDIQLLYAGPTEIVDPMINDIKELLKNGNSWKVNVQEVFEKYFNNWNVFKQNFAEGKFVNFDAFPGSISALGYVKNLDGKREPQALQIGKSVEKMKGFNLFGDDAGYYFIVGNGSGACTAMSYINKCWDQTIGFGSKAEVCQTLKESVLFACAFDEFSGGQIFSSEFTSNGVFNYLDAPMHYCSLMTSEFIERLSSEKLYPDKRNIKNSYVIHSTNSKLNEAVVAIRILSFCGVDDRVLVKIIGINPNTKYCARLVTFADRDEMLRCDPIAMCSHMQGEESGEEVIWGFELVDANIFVKLASKFGDENSL